MDLRLNLDYVVENQDQTKKLAAALDTTNVSLKKQVFEILGALCVHSPEGYGRALEVLEHYKSQKDERYRFKVVVSELREGNDQELLSTVAAFLNCSIIAAKSLEERIRIRNEYLGLKILDAISLLRTRFSENEGDLFVQLDIFEEQRLADESQLTGPRGVDLNSHQDVFYAILRQVAGSPPEFPFLHLLQHLLRLDVSLPISDVLWETCEKLVHRATLCESREAAEKLLRAPLGQRCQCSCHGADGRARKRTPFSPPLLSPSSSLLAFNPELLAAVNQQAALAAVPPPPPPPGPPPPPPPPPPRLPPPPPEAPAAVSAQTEARLPQQSTPRPKNKMKTLNWTKIPSAKVVGRTNLWSLIAKAHDGSPNNLDFESIEGLFCQTNLLNGPAATHNSLERKKKESLEINLLDGKRSLNVNIFLKQFRSSNDEIVAILQRGAHAEIGAEKLRGLLKILPESDEIELLRSHATQRNRLGNAEKFLLQLIELPNYKLRCEGMLLKEEFSANMTYLEPAIETIESAVEELRHCQELHEILYMLVVMGNFLNSGSYAGDAAGFKLMSLIKVAEIRANKPGMNLIHYVAQEAENKFRNLLRFPDLLPSLEEASKLSIDNLKTEIANLSNKVDKISQQVAASGEDVRQQMEEFLKFAVREMAQVKKELDNLEKVRVDMAEFLCEDLQSFKLEDCFKVFHSFCQKFKSAIEENAKRRQNERRAAERRRHREEQANRKNFGENRPSSFSGSESDNNVVDRSRATTSEEDPVSSPQVGRRRIGSDTQSSRVRGRLSSSDRETNLIDFLRSTAEADAADKTAESGSLDRSWFRRSSRRRRPEMLSVELNDRERPASPGPSPLLERKAIHAEPSKSKQWRVKIEEWLQENEKEQEREKTLRDKIAFERLKRENEKITSGEEKSVDKGLATLQEAKTDTEIYAKKSKVLKPAETENAECMPLKDKSKWRKSNLNVANSSESIDDERRKSRSRRNASDTEMDTISFYIARSVDNLIPCDNASGDKVASQNVACSRKDQQEQKDSDKTIIEPIDTNPSILVGRSRFYQPMETPNKIEPICNKNLSEVQELSYKKDCESKRSDEDMPTDREDVNFDRFSHMRKTTRRGKSRNRAGENENKKSEDVLEGDLKVNPQEIQVVYSKPQKFIDMDSKLPEPETQNMGDEIIKNSGSYVGENGECGEEKRKDKSMSLKAKLSKRLLSLTENLKVGAKPVDTAQSVEDKRNILINDSPCPQIDKMLSERRASLSEEKINPILEHREKILSRPHQDLVQIPVKNKVQATCNPIIISKPQFLKGSYASDQNNVPIAPETPTTPDVKVLEAYPGQKGREECEKDEGFEETQSQLSEVASQGAGSSYDTDLADSPRSLRQIKDANTSNNPVGSSVHSSGNKTPVDSKQDEKKPQENQILEPCQPIVNSYQSREASIVREPPKRNTLSKSNSVRMPVSKAGIGRNNLRATLSSTTAKNSEIKPQLPANLRTSSQSSRGKVSTSDSKITKKPSLRGLGNLIETSPKIGRRVAAYTKAIKSMTHNLQDSKKFENYDVTQSMPPTPSEEKKTFTSGLKSIGNGKKARSSSSVYSPRPHSRLSINACLGPQSRRGSEKSISSDKSVNLSRKSSEASVITVKSATRSPVPTTRHPKRAVTSPSQLSSPAKTKTRIIRPKSPIQTKQLRVPNSLKPVTRTNSVPKQKSSTVQPNLAVRRTSSERASFTFMKATSASSAKSSPTKWTQEQNKFKSPNNQRPVSKPISLASSQSRIKQRY